MITRKNAIEIGASIVNAAKREISITLQVGISANVSARIVGARGTAYEALQNVWYDLLSDRVKESFGYSLGAYMQACGWKNLD